ncbi:ATP synthase F1 subunit epsilon [Acidipila rosea]|uniref:ATP synthase epsilon chain n=1 Tax=Acidipila rosea TaxID=768535 RepID=A0A4R1L6D5_9BACT|nr:ATP synthase F1 subunit epsilon [Acidipila rosea]MBW4026812.1 ATP synthase F1 subunit epsilon [Acidobacteriota bacterium]MBW4043391.1 ATP synthase F1 subunit epsilon [Acidobacteriota bacterium]TCK73694.1 ATP synthase F1 subcomplex epsilon subunit [Acidipila rosea]
MADTNKLRVRLVTPDRILVDTDADAVEVPSKSGYLEALFGAAPLLAELGTGEVRLHGAQEGDQRFNVARGFVEVLPDRVTILAESALKPEEIDTARAQSELQEGQKVWNEAGEDAEQYVRANEIIAEAESKLASAAHKS